MSVKVLIVDDSLFFQNRLKEMIGAHPDIEVVAVANDGKEAVAKAAELKPDVITMDYEMPEMDGVTAVREIMANNPIPIIMFSSLTYEGAQVTLDALSAGAVDFMAKNFAEFSRDSRKLSTTLQDRILAVAMRGDTAVASAAPATGFSTSDSAFKKTLASHAPAQKPAVIVIGASTGGPVALTEVLSALPADFSIPIVLVQHMPANFTMAFAERLDRECQIKVRHAEHGESMEPGTAYLAPGGKQLLFNKSNPLKLDVIDGDASVSYKPSVDLTFTSASEAFASRSFGVVLTGMGSDGCEGARAIKNRGGIIWSQDEASSVIYGMPMAVARANLSDHVLPLHQFASQLSEVS
ncbi:MAG: chemotaxis response regulator protein-glutamate methylesterase [Cellvibrionaceae bacterium]|nr:chemotaxis response regulator protein-glutamate methylesterase [Cellvibrionaceae bacterium]